MWIISSAKRRGFSVGFNFAGRKISNVNDIRDACFFIYCEKAVLYKHRHHAQKWHIPPKSVAIAHRDSMLSALAESIWKYFNSTPNTMNSQPEFDSFHDTLCNWFEGELNRTVRSVVGLPNATYGNAQKMINVLFKYLSCFDDYPEYADLFSYCHVPIDNYILCGLSTSSVLCKIPGVVKIPYDYQYNGLGWYGFDRDTYRSLVDNYRRYITKPSDLSYLAVEFDLWIAGNKKRKCILPTSGTMAAPIAEFHK